MINGISKNNKGGMLVVVLLVTTLFIVISIGIIELGFLRKKLLEKQIAQTQSMHIAEAGVNYYRWHLAHAPSDYYDGTGADPGDPGEPYGPYIHSYNSQDGQIEGIFSLEITPPPPGGTIVGIESTGWTLKKPSIKSSIKTRYGLKSMAHYSYLTNSNAWFRANENTRGEVHSNGGVRVDGSNDSLVTSSRDSYVCGINNGCNLSNCSTPCTWVSSTCNCPGVWGAGANFDLWSNPVPIVDFNIITVYIANLKNMAISPGGYFPETTGNRKGYHIIFKNDNTFDIYIVQSLKNSLNQHNDNQDGFTNISEEIETETFLSSHPIPLNKIIYLEDDVWIEGTLNDRITLVAARLPDNSNKRKSIIINNNLTYLNRDGSSILGLIAQKDIKIPAHAPHDLTIDAIMLAQNGRVFRNLYSINQLKGDLTIFGSTISNKNWSWFWTDSSDNIIDGYSNVQTIIDNSVYLNPPPYFPTTGEYEFLTWDEL